MVNNSVLTKYKMEYCKQFLKQRIINLPFFHYNSETNNVEGPWKFLPVTVLESVFSYLSDGDRFNAALVCQSWSVAFNSEFLWRKRKFTFQGFKKAQHDMEMALSFSQQFGGYLRNLEILCERPTFVVCQKFQKTIAEILSTLINQKCQLKELSFPEIQADRYWHSNSVREKVIISLAKFLCDQHSLQKFDMSNAGLTLNSGLKILQAFLTGLRGKRKLRILNLEHFFHAGLEIFRVGKFMHFLSSIQHLNSLYINYNCLSDDALKILTRTCRGTLKFLSIIVHKDDPHFEDIHAMIWRGLKNACPALKVNFYFECIGEYTPISRILGHAIPLHSLKISGESHIPGEVWKIPDTIRYLGDVFSTTLKELSLDLEAGGENLEEAFIYMMQKLKHLKVLHVKTTLSLDTVEELVKLRRDNQIGLKRCCLDLISPLPVPMSQEEFNSHLKKYRDMFKDHKEISFCMNLHYTSIIHVTDN